MRKKMETAETTAELIDQLIQHWACWEDHEVYYLTVLAPHLAHNIQLGDGIEQTLLAAIKRRLNDDEWAALPHLIAQQRRGVRCESQYERLKREIQEAVRKETEYLESEQAKRDALLQQRREQWEREAEERKTALLADLRRLFATDFLAASSFYLKRCIGVIPPVLFHAEQKSFVRSWVISHMPRNKGAADSIPDNEQIAAISAVDGHVQVVARAGSGKTTTLVHRVLFLLKHCRVPPDKILVLAFNKKAALEVRRRLLKLTDPTAEQAIVGEIEQRIKAAPSKRRVDRSEIEAHVVDTVAAERNIALPHVMTFHALAYAIVRPEESLLHDVPDGESRELSRVFQQVIDDHLREPVFKGKIRELMLAHFRADWERIVEGRYDQTQEEFLRYRRSLPRVTLDGQHVKSYGEKLIADFLFEHGVAYKYERNHWWNDINYRPDFTIFKTPKSGVIIEYFGLKGDPDYDESAERKREYWRNKPDWALIEFDPGDIVDDGPQEFPRRLKIALERAGVRCSRLSEDEIWNRIRDRAIDRFTGVTVGFVGRCRKQSLSADDLLDLINSYSPLSPVERMFLDLAHTLYAAYLDRLSSTGEDDFDGLMQRAAQSVESGITAFKRRSGSGDLASLQYVSVDEFQDFSDLFHRLLVAIRRTAPQAELFCVGDDWQAINGFAGSDLRFFDRFEEYVGKSRRLYLSTNYRSASSIVAVGNALMSGLGKPASAKRAAEGEVWLADLGLFTPSQMEKRRHPGDIITPSVLRLANTALTAGKDVVLLCRRNSLPWFVNYQDQAAGRERRLEGYLDLVRSYFPTGLRERISISTVHKYKGLEKSMVIVLDAVARSYPLIHPDWAFSRILGDSPQKIIEEERRLLYVALTRAADTLVVLTDGKSKSPFLADFDSGTSMSAIDWASHSPPGGTVTRLIVKIANQQQYGVAPTFHLKDQLKASGYRWQSNAPTGWEKSFPVAGFRIDTLKSEVWSESADGIVVRVTDESDQLIAQFRIDDGRWTTVIDRIDEVCKATTIPADGKPTPGRDLT